MAFDWPVAVCHCDCERKIGLPVDDWQVVVSSSLAVTMHIHSVNSQVCALLLVVANDNIISVGVWTLNHNISVTFDFFQFRKIGHNITVVHVQIPAIFYYFGDKTRSGGER